MRNINQRFPSTFSQLALAFYLAVHVCAAHVSSPKCHISLAAPSPGHLSCPTHNRAVSFSCIIAILLQAAADPVNVYRYQLKHQYLTMGKRSTQSTFKTYVHRESALKIADEAPLSMLKERYKCPHFRILIIGRANAGKTTILEKVCGVERGTKPIIYDQDGMLEPC